MALIRFDWKTILWDPSTDTWKRSLVGKLQAVNFPPNIELLERMLERAVYVIRLNGVFAVKYPNGTSPTIYIGEGNFKQRISHHREWVNELQELAGPNGFEVRIATPRVQNHEGAYQACEADLLKEFKEIFGTVPLRNRQVENTNFAHKYVDEEITQVLKIGQGRRYLWEIAPMKANALFEAYKI